MPERHAYLEALKMLGRRELSESQVRQRLARRGFEAAEVDAAVARLRSERAVDDDRVAEALARTELVVRRRGRLRVRRQIEAVGITAAAARRAVDLVYADTDETALLDAALMKRLAGRGEIADDREFARLFRYLVGQGFDPRDIRPALDRRAARRNRRERD